MYGNLIPDRVSDNIGVVISSGTVYVREFFINSLLTYSKGRLMDRDDLV